MNCKLMLLIGLAIGLLAGGIGGYQIASQPGAVIKNENRADRNQSPDKTPAASTQSSEAEKNARLCVALQREINAKSEALGMKGRATKAWDQWLDEMYAKAPPGCELLGGLKSIEWEPLARRKKHE